MWCSRVQCTLVLLSIALAVLSAGSAPTDNRFREILQKSMAATGIRGKGELTLVQLLSELGNAENEALEAEMSPMGERRAARDGYGSSLKANRDRKAGCKNFFWKTFTAC
ncbi:somatostatin 1, tandem duplicate 1 [Carcharodon carcharias]|uniref:somatostatin 1, tandem duplicate 1 n=1 Tax=Carcharodon carcharias TaxID=13397 RepID=UPI001B7F2DBE|nr:somatostatin 1, tandem duplicate 1 [Carcharodon carcharias]